MTPEEVIADVIADEQVDEHRYGNGCMYAPTVGEKAVAALGVAGYAITKLPEPSSGPDKDGHVEFSEGSAAGEVSTDIGSGVVWSQGWEWTANQARNVAAVWLAAAVAAEEVR